MSPNRPLLGLGAMLLALALGLGVGFALDANDSSIRDPEQLRDLVVTTPVLAISRRSICQGQLHQYPRTQGGGLRDMATITNEMPFVRRPRSSRPRPMSPRLRPGS